jgi:hypothetical protein
LYNRQSENINNPSLLYLAVSIERDLFFKRIMKKDKPKQYQIGIDTFQRSESNLIKEEIIAICKFNIDKYCWRKKDQDKEDFKKIIDYANWAIKNL